MPNQIASPIDVAEVAARLRIAMARMSRRLRRETDGEHSASAISALATVSRLGVVSLGELAEAEGISRPSMTVLAASLESQRLLVREPEAGDRRLVRVRIAPAGKQALARSRTRRNAYFAKRLRRLGENELRILEGASGILEQLLEEA